MGNMNWMALLRVEVEALLAHDTIPQTEQTSNIEKQRGG